MKKLLMIAATLAGCALVGLAFWSTAMPDADHDDDHDHHDEEFVHFSDDMIQEHKITTQPAGPGTLKQRVRAPAEITIGTDQLAHILPKVGGIAVAAYKNIGELVHEGEVLAVIESKEIAEAKSNYMTALKRHQLAESIFQRESNLHEKSLSSGEDYLRAKNLIEESLIDVELSRQRLQALGLSYDEIFTLPQQNPESMRTYELRSPMAGRVISRHITTGEMLSPTNEVYVIADLSKVWAEVNIFSQDRESVKIGQPVYIINSRGKKSPSTVAFLSPVVDPATRTSTALAAIDNTSEEWVPGTFVQVEFITDAVDVPLSVPRDAIQNIDGNDVVFVCKEGGFVMRPITTDRSDEDCCEVIDGLEEGESYACTNTFLLKADLKKEEAEHMD